MRLDLYQALIYTYIVIASDCYYWASNDKPNREHGPLPLLQIRYLVTSGHLTGEDFLFHASWNKWAPLKNLPLWVQLNNPSIGNALVTPSMSTSPQSVNTDYGFLYAAVLNSEIVFTALLVNIYRLWSGVPKLLRLVMILIIAIIFLAITGAQKIIFPQ